MKPEPFNITYQGQSSLVEQSTDTNDELFYKITFPDSEKMDIYITPVTDGSAPNWAEGTGEVTNRTKEIGDLIEAYEQ